MLIDVLRFECALFHDAILSPPGFLERVYQQPFLRFFSRRESSRSTSVSLERLLSDECRLSRFIILIKPEYVKKQIPATIAVDLLLEGI